MSDKHIDQQKTAEMRRIMAEKGDAAIDERYGSQAHATEEYREAVRQREAQERRDQERRRRAIEESHDKAEETRRQYAQEHEAQVEQDRQRDDHAREQADQQRQAEAHVQRDREATAPDPTDDRSPNPATSADRGAEQSMPEPETPAEKSPDRTDQLLAELTAKREAREREGLSR